MAYGANSVVVLLPSPAADGRSSPMIGKQGIQHNPDGLVGNFKARDAFKKITERTDNREHRSTDLSDLSARVVEHPEDEGYG